ncbi:MAG: LysR family transcriptional regulator [Polyangiales bacterium]
MSDAPTLESPLLYFLAVVENGSFSSAARAIGISQPSLSVAVRRLEERLGTQLLHRESRGASPTRAGQVLALRVQESIALLGRAKDEIDALDGEPRGHYNIGVHESLGAYFLPGFMGEFVMRHPRVELGLFNAPSRDVETAILERRVDLGLVVNPVRHPDSVVSGLFDDVVVLVVASKLRKQWKTTKELLAETPLLHVPSIVQTQAVLQGLGRDGYVVPRRVACSSMALVKNLVLGATGVGILPWRVATHGVPAKRIELVDPKLPSYRDHIALVRRADAPMTRTLRLLLDGLKAHGKTVAALPKLSKSMS